MAAAYNQTQHFQTGQPTNPMQAFEETLRYAVEQRADLLILAGISSATHQKRHLSGCRASSRKPQFHSFISPGTMTGTMKACPEARRSCERPDRKRLKPLYQGANPLMSYRDVNGIRFIALDNSTYEIQPEQVEFYKKHVQFDGPVLLVTHIPFYVPGRPSLMDAVIRNGALSKTRVTNWNADSNGQGRVIPK